MKIHLGTPKEKKSFYTNFGASIHGVTIWPLLIIRPTISNFLFFFLQTALADLKQQGTESHKISL